MPANNTIRIFIGSSITELELERAKLMSFIQRLNNKYHKQGIFIEGYICEETPNNMRVGGSQQMHNDYINNEADATIFMFFHKAGEFTLEELRLAREAFLQKDKPNVFIFFKAVDKAPDVTEEIQKAVSTVFNDYGHYYKMFDDVDTIKLELLQFLCDMLPGNAELVVKDGAVLVNGEAVQEISAANVFAYQNNPELRRLKDQIEAFEKRAAEARERGDEDAALRYSVALDEKRKQYYTLETDILNMLQLFYEESKKGRSDPVLADALKQLELGNVEEAKLLLPQDSLRALADSLASRRRLAEAELKEDSEKLLSRSKVRIKALHMDVENPNRFEEIERTYEDAYEEAKAAKDYDFIYDYANFLYDQKNYPKAIMIAEKLYSIFIDPDERDKISDYDRARLLNLLGMLNNDNNEPSKAERYYLDAKELCESSNATDSQQYWDILVSILNNLAVLYKNTDKIDIAEKMYLEGLELRCKLSESPTLLLYDSIAASIRYNLANLYLRNGKPVLAEKLSLEVLETYRRLAEVVSESYYEPQVALACMGLANVYRDSGIVDKAEELYLEALTINRRLSKTVSKAKYDPIIANNCFNLAILYKNNREFEKAEKLYIQALEIDRRLSESVSKEAYSPYVASACHNLANVYFATNRLSKARKFYLEALNIRRWLTNKVSNSVFAPKQADTTHILATLYLRLGNTNEAEKLFLDALKIRSKLAESVGHEKYDPYVADTCHNLALLYLGKREYAYAENLLEEVLEIYRRLFKTTHKKFYELDIAITLYELCSVYSMNGNPDKSKECIEEAKRIEVRHNYDFQ